MMDYQVPIFTRFEPPAIVIQKPVEEKPPEPKFYVIVLGDNLTSIAEAHHTSVERLCAANPELANPDLITPNKPLKIPENDEVLPARPLPSNIEVSAQAGRPARADKPLTRGFSVSGNSYVPGNCVWGIKNWVSWVPNGWGSAYQWVGRAKAQGFTISDTPQVGDVASLRGGNHVALIIGVSGSKATIREMNYRKLYDVNERTVPVSSWQFIRP